MFGIRNVIHWSVNQGIMVHKILIRFLSQLVLAYPAVILNIGI